MVMILDNGPLSAFVMSYLRKTDCSAWKYIRRLTTLVVSEPSVVSEASPEGNIKMEDSRAN